MRLVIYSPQGRLVGNRLKMLLPSSAKTVSREIFRTIQDLEERLRSPMTGSTIIILDPYDSDELSSLLLLRPLYRDTSIILLLPDQSDTTLTKAHTLYPRFVMYSEGNLSDAAAITNKMIGNRL